jgi:hypothetical protein
MRKRVTEPEPDYIREYREYMWDKDPQGRGGPIDPNAKPPQWSSGAVRARDSCCCHCCCHRHQHTG